MNDIQNRTDIETLIDQFYGIVIKDEVIGYIFTDVFKVNWELHLPIMYGFWETVLLDNMTYKGNPILKHIDVNQKEKLLPVHFERWIKLWEKTINHNFKGEKAEEAKKRAKMMSELMMFKIKQSESNNFIQ